MTLKSALITLIACGAVFYVIFWIRQGRLMQKSGHLPWRRTLTALMVWRALMPLVGKLFVGPIHVYGKEKLKGLKGNKLLVPNHSFQMDFTLVSVATRLNFFFMTKSSELKGAAGFFGARAGAIPFNPKEQGGGQAAVDASIRALCRSCENSLLIFPQGALKPQLPLVREDFKSGAIRIGRAVAERTSEDVWVVPMGMYYLREKADEVKAAGKLLGKLRRAFGVVNYGAIVVLGEPVRISQLASDDDAATTAVFLQIEQLVKQAAEIAESNRKTGGTSG